MYGVVPKKVENITFMQIYRKMKTFPMNTWIRICPTNSELRAYQLTVHFL
jgi:hypothetical protein